MLPSPGDLLVFAHPGYYHSAEACSHHNSFPRTEISSCALWEDEAGHFSSVVLAHLYLMRLFEAFRLSCVVYVDSSSSRSRSLNFVVYEDLKDLVGQLLASLECSPVCCARQRESSFLAALVEN